MTRQEALRLGLAKDDERRCCRSRRMPHGNPSFDNDGIHDRRRMLVNYPSAQLIRQVSAVLLASTLSLVLPLSAPAHAQPDAASLQTLLDS